MGRSKRDGASQQPGQMAFDFDAHSLPLKPARPRADADAPPRTVAQPLRRRPTRSSAPEFYRGCLGKRPPPPTHGEIPLNTKKAAHTLGKPVKWLEAQRHRPNSPPWIKTGGGYEYFASQLAWWRATLNAGGGEE